MASLMRRTLVRKELAPAEAGGADLQQLEADRATRGAGELGVGEADAAQGTQQHIGHRGEPQAQLVGAYRRRRSTVGKQIELTFFDAVFHVAAGAVDLLVERLRCGVLGTQRSDDKPRISRAAGPFRLGYDPAMAAPAVARRPGKLLEAARRLAGRFAVLLGRGEFVGNLGGEPLVCCAPIRGLPARP